jgi:nucleolar protein 9
MSKDHIVSRTIQAALTSRNASMITTRKLIQHFYGHIEEMALDKAASHVVDCIWEGTHGLAFIRERIAEELAENEAQLRDSSCGRAVWKNWKMDLYKRRRQYWVRQSKVKASNDGFQSFSELDENNEKDGKAKTPIQLARERHARERQKKGRSKSGSERSSRPGRPGRPEAPSAGSTAAATAST